MSVFHPDKKPEYEEVTEAVVKRYCLHCDSQITKSSRAYYSFSGSELMYACTCSTWEEKKARLKWRNWR